MQAELLPVFNSAAIDACQNVLSVDFDFLNSGVSVITDRRIKDVDRRAIQTAITQAGQTVRPDVEHWPVQIRRVRDYAFIPHGRIEPYRLMSSPRPGSIPVFDIPYAALMSMREGEQRLKVLAEGFDYIVPQVVVVIPPEEISAWFAAMFPIFPARWQGVLHSQGGRAGLCNSTGMASQRCG